MKGTEKQIGWANEIMGRLNDILDQIMANIPDRYNQQQKDAMTAMIEQMRGQINGAEYAGDVIDLFKGVKTPEDLMSMWRVALPNTAGQHKILGR